jgi:hypothetical protein
VATNQPSAPRMGGLPKMGDDARSEGAADLNETIPAEQRAPKGNQIPKTDGPRMHDTGAYLPAEYPIVASVEQKDGTVVQHKMIRQDR